MISTLEAIQYHKEVLEEKAPRPTDEELLNYTRLHSNIKKALLLYASGLSLQQVGKLIPRSDGTSVGISAEVVRQKIGKACRILRHPSNSWIVFNNSKINSWVHGEL